MTEKKSLVQTDTTPPPHATGSYVEALTSSEISWEMEMGTLDGN